MHKVTAKKAKYIFNRLYSLFEQKNNSDSKLLKYFNYIEDEIEEILFPKFGQSTLNNNIIIKIFCNNYFFYCINYSISYIFKKSPIRTNSIFYILIGEFRIID